MSVSPAGATGHRGQRQQAGQPRRQQKNPIAEDGSACPILMLPSDQPRQRSDYCLTQRMHQKAEGDLCPERRDNGTREADRQRQIHQALKLSDIFRHCQDTGLKN